MWTTIRYMVIITYSKKEWLLILLVVSWIGKINISLSPFVPENLVSRDGFGSPVPPQPAHLHSQAESSAYLTRFLPYRWRSLPRVRRRKASKSPSNGCCLSLHRHGPNNMRLSFPHLLLIWSEHVESTGVYHRVIRPQRNENQKGTKN